MLLNFNPQNHKKSGCKQSKSSESIIARVNSELEAELVEARKQKETILLERNSLLDSLKRTNEEFILLKKKRIQDVRNICHHMIISPRMSRTKGCCFFQRFRLAFPFYKLFCFIMGLSTKG